jgi:hypothetical protein
MRNRVLLGLAVAGFALAQSAAARADSDFECRNAWAEQKADVDGPVLSVGDQGPQKGDKGRYRLVVRDRFTGCRIGDDALSVCRVGQHASIVGGSFGDWTGDVKDSDSDYPYLGKHLWTCE